MGTMVTIFKHKTFWSATLDRFKLQFLKNRWKDGRCAGTLYVCFGTRLNFCINLLHSTAGPYSAEKISLRRKQACSHSAPRFGFLNLEKVYARWVS